MELLHFAVSFVATVCFAMLFNVPRRQYVVCGFTGAVGWMCYWLLSASVSLSAASFVAAMVLAALSRVFAVRRKAPITVFLLSGIFPLVPGAGIYNTAYAFFMDDNAMAVYHGVETLKCAVAIALGIALVLSIPYRRRNPEKTS